MNAVISRYVLVACFLGWALAAPGAGAATITGTVFFDGQAPKMKPIEMNSDPVCAALHTEPVLTEQLVLGEGQTMANVFVYVKSGLKKKRYDPPKTPFVVTQKGCVYTPHVFGVMAGQPVTFLNPDGTLHNVHGLCKVNREFNKAMPSVTREFTMTFDKPEFMFLVKCDVHPWMGARCAVMSHPFFSVTDKTGKFKIDNLEPGTYEIEAWHEVTRRLPPQQQTVTVGAGETKTIDFKFTPVKK